MTTTVSVDCRAVLVAALLALITTVTSLPASNGSMHETNDAAHGRRLSSAAPCTTIPDPDKLRGKNEDGVGYKESICGKGKSCGVDEHGFEMQVDHRVECAVFTWVLEMMVEAGTAGCPTTKAMESFKEHVVNTKTNLQRVPQVFNAPGGGNGQWGPRMTGIRKVNSELLSQRPAGYYSTVLIKQGEAAVQLLEADSCANAPPWCRELLENVGGVVGKQMAYICNGISGVADCDKLRKMPKLQALVEKLDQTFDPTAKLIKDGIGNAGQAAQDAAKEAAEKTTKEAAENAAEKVTKEAAETQAKKEMMEKTAAKAEKKLGETAGEEVMEQVAKKTTTMMTTAEEAAMKNLAKNLKGVGTLGAGVLVGMALDPVLDPTTDKMGDAVGDAVQKAASNFVDDDKADFARNTTSEGVSEALKGTVGAGIIEIIYLYIVGGLTFTAAALLPALTFIGWSFLLMFAGFLVFKMFEACLNGEVDLNDFVPDMN